MSENRRGDSSAIARGLEDARKMRTDYLNRFATGNIGFHELVEISKQQDFKAISVIKLKDLLETLDGWSTEDQALSALEHYGFAPKDSIKSIRRSLKKVNAFDSLLKIPSDRWAHRPHLPENFPFEGKLYEVLGILQEDGMENLEADTAYRISLNPEDPVNLSDETIEHIYDENTPDDIHDLFEEDDDDLEAELFEEDDK